MEGESDARKKFEEYLKEKKGQPINPQAKATAERELELGRKGDFAVYGDEPSREKLIARYPKGRMSEKDAEEGEEEGRELNAKDAVAEIANMKKLAESGKCHPKENMTERELRYATTELTDAKDFIMSLIEEGELEGVKEQLELGVVTTMLASEYNIRGTLNELPNKIEELIKRYTEAIKYFQNKPSE